MNVGLIKGFVGVNTMDCDFVVYNVHREEDEEYLDQGWLEAGTLRPHPEQDEEHVGQGSLED